MEKNKNKYFGVLQLIDYFESGDLEITRREQKLIHKLMDVFTTDRTNCITESVFQEDSNFKGLLSDIDQEIAYLNHLIDNFQRKGLSVEFIARKTVTYESQIGRLNQLKQEILKYQAMHSMPTKKEKQELIDAAVDALTTNIFHLPTFFGKPIAERPEDGKDHYRVNEDVIQRVYETLEDDKRVEELQKGVALIEEEKSYQETLAYCDEATSNKGVMFQNLDEIIAYNQLNRKLYRLIGMSKDPKFDGIDEKLLLVNNKLRPYLDSSVKRLLHKEEMNRLLEARKNLIAIKVRIDGIKADIETVKKQILEAKRELGKKGLAAVLSKVSEEEILGEYSDKHPCSIATNFSCFISREALEQYYEMIDEKASNSQVMLNQISVDKKELFDGMSAEARELFETDYDTCHSLVELSKAGMNGDVSPSIGLFILYSLITLDQASLYDMKINDFEYERIANYYSRVIKNAFDSYNSDFVAIMNPNSRTLDYMYIKS